MSEEHDTRCLRCGETWKRRVKKPDRCVECGSKLWNRSLDSIEDLLIKIKRLPQIQKREILQMLSSTRNEGGGEYEGEQNG